MSENMLPDTSREAVAGRLVAVRRAKGMTSGAMAVALKVMPQRWSNYEQGRNYPPPDLLSRFWQVTGATSDYVLFGRMDGLPSELYLKLSENDGAERSA